MLMRSDRMVDYRRTTKCQMGVDRTEPQYNKPCSSFFDNLEEPVRFWLLFSTPETLDSLAQATLCRLVAPFFPSDCGSCEFSTRTPRCVSSERLRGRICRCDEEADPLRPRP